HRLQAEGAHHGGGSKTGGMIYRVVTAQGGRGGRRAATVVIGAVGGSPWRGCKGSAIEEIDRAGQWSGGRAIGDLLDSRVAHAGEAADGDQVLQVAVADRAGHGVRSFVGGLDLVQVPLIVLPSRAIGAVLQRVSGAAKFVVGIAGVPDVEAG